MKGHVIHKCPALVTIQNLSDQSKQDWTTYAFPSKEEPHSQKKTTTTAAAFAHERPDVPHHQPRMQRGAAPENFKAQSPTSRYGFQQATHVPYWPNPNGIPP